MALKYEYSKKTEVTAPHTSVSNGARKQLRKITLNTARVGKRKFRHM
jgi:hypothetical protein